MSRRLFIAGVEVPILNDVSIPITYTIEDLQHPDQTSFSYSETIELPSVQQTDDIFEHIYNPSIDLQSFNPNLKTDVYLLVNNSQTFSGYLKLKKTFRDRKTGVIKYTCEFIGEKADLFIEVGDKLIIGNPNPLDDLDFSEYDHVLSIANVTDSWIDDNVVNGTAGTSMNPGEGYRYGLADYGYLGSGMNGGSNTDYRVNHLRPLLFAREILHKIFIDAGKTWTSTFLDSAFFKKILVSCGEAPQVIYSQQEQRQMLAGIIRPNLASQAASYSLTYNGSLWDANPNVGPIVFSDDSTPPFNDVGNQYNLTNGELTVNTTGTYVLSSVVNIYNNIAYVPGSNGAKQYNIYDYDFRLIIEKWSGVAWIPFVSGTPDTGTGATSPYYKQHTISYTGVFSAGHKFRISVYSDLDNVDLQNSLGNHISDGTATHEVYVDQDSTLSFKLSSTDVDEGDSVEVNQALPKFYKQKDFIKSLFTAFNLYIYEDKNNFGNYFIEPEKTFFNGTPVDWTGKVDTDESEESIIMGELDAKRYTLSFKSDSDFYNKDYEDNYKKGYGEKEYVMENQFLVNNKKIEVDFAATPLVGHYENRLIMPKIFKKEASTIEKISSTPRLWFWGGMINLPLGSWVLKGSTNQTNYSYPYVGTLDDPYTPTFDLHFGLPRQVYLEQIPPYSMPTSNLGTEYWKPLMDRISDKSGRIVRMKVVLDSLDIKDFDFRKPVIIDSVLYRVHKISGFDATSEKSTWVEFVKF